MIIVNLKKILDDKNITLYSLQQDTNITYPALYKLAKNQTKSISFDVLEKICISLDCDINDLLTIER